MCQCYIFLIYQITPFLFSQWPYETRFYSLVLWGGNLGKVIRVQVQWVTDNYRLIVLSVRFFSFSLFVSIDFFYLNCAFGIVNISLSLNTLCFTCFWTQYRLSLSDPKCSGNWMSFLKINVYPFYIHAISMKSIALSTKQKSIEIELFIILKWVFNANVTYVCVY